MIGHVKRFHTGIKKFVCEECGKSFSVKPSYKDHMLTHSTSDPKPFKCVICPKSFASKGTLSVHLKKTHKNDRIHHCDFPGCNFSAKGRFLCNEVFDCWFFKLHLIFHQVTDISINTSSDTQKTTNVSSATRSFQLAPMSHITRSFTAHRRQKNARSATAKW